MAAHLTNALKGNTKKGEIEWTREFQKLKGKLVTPTLTENLRSKLILSMQDWD